MQSPLTASNACWFFIRSLGILQRPSGIVGFPAPGIPSNTICRIADTGVDRADILL